MIRTFILTAALLFLSFSPAQAQEVERYSQILLTPQKTKIEAGETIYVAIEQKIAPEWHTYWSNPGDSGEPMRVRWELPPGFVAGKMLWPTPGKVPYDVLVNYGYHDNAVILQEIKAPPDFSGEPVTLGATIDILVCNDICIPESGHYELTLNDRDEENESFIAAAFDSIPAVFEWPVTMTEDGEDFVLTITFDNMNFQSPARVFGMGDKAVYELFPYEWGIIDNTAAARATLSDEKLVIRQKRGSRPLEDIEEGRFVITITDENGQRTAIEVSAHTNTTQQEAIAPAAPSPNTTQPLPPPEKTSGGIFKALFFALLGGLILNLMPCVFPILSMKALSLCHISGKENKAAILHGLEYTAGVLVSFAVIAGLLIFLKAGGAHIGWGFHLQNPIIVLFLSYLLFVIGLNLAGFFEIKGIFTNLGANLTRPDKVGGSFFTGVLATMVATPCTAPFMGVAMGFALTQPAPIALSVFLALGFGLALPYLLLTLFPPLRKALPKPGPWMVGFKEFLAFPMFASGAWLIWVYAQQTSSIGVLAALGGTVGIAFGIWLLRRPVKAASTHIIVTAIAALFFVLAGLVALLDHNPMKSCTVETPAHAFETAVLEEPYSTARFEELEKGNDPLFINMTADWCITCKVNERVALNRAETKALFADWKIRSLKGDWTNSNAEITNFLADFDRQGVPLYIYYAPRDPETGIRPAPVVLPQLLTPEIIRNTIQHKE
ncbi:MAG: thioredoxin family protein [Rhodospirillales bacterium]|nr:thioredoxin family protein [Rhodospirillales bacterium]